MKPLTYKKRALNLLRDLPEGVIESQVEAGKYLRVHGMSDPASVLESMSSEEYEDFLFSSGLVA